MSFFGTSIEVCISFSSSRTSRLTLVHVTSMLDKALFGRVLQTLIYVNQMRSVYITAGKDLGICKGGWVGKHSH